MKQPLTPPRARELLRDMLGHFSQFYHGRDVEALLQGFFRPRLTTFRLNALDPRNAAAPEPRVAAEVLTHLGLPASSLVRHALHAKSFAVRSAAATERAFMRLEAMQSGQIILQSWSSMLPVLLGGLHGEVERVRNEKRADGTLRVLDLCAAPGSKTVQCIEQLLACAQGHRIEVLANELDEKRAERLRIKLRASVPAHEDFVTVRVGDARTIRLRKAKDADADEEEPASPSSPPLEASAAAVGEGAVVGPFDVIICDVPCSGTGTVQLDSHSAVPKFSQESLERHSRAQLGLLTAARRLVRPGGAILFSTCALSPEENETVVHRCLERFPDLEAVPLALPDSISTVLARCRQGLANSSGDSSKVARDWTSGGAASAEAHAFSPAIGFHPLVGEIHPGVRSHSLRVFPTDFYEGFFICKLRRRE
jgi:16S rRNA C967 or C1407 C5-methylase (RsmB/RsmF family)